MKSNLAKFSNTLKTSFPKVRDNTIEKEIFPLDSPALESSKGRSPDDADIYYEEPVFIENNIPMYDNPKIKFSEKGIVGIFPAISNLVKTPEDMSQSDWSQSNTSSTLTYLNFRKRKFTKVESTTGTTTASVTQEIIFTSSASKTIRATVKKGDQTEVTIMLWDADVTTARLQLDIDFSSQSITETTGTLVEANWYGDNIVEIVGLSTSITHGNENRIYLYPGKRGETSSIGDYTYFTAIAAYDSDQHLPYFKDGGSRNNLEYPVEWPSKGSIELWVLPQFSYDTGYYHDVISDRISAGDTGFILRYHYPDDQYALYITDDDGSSWDILYFGNDGSSWGTGNAFTSDDILKQWTYFKITWDDSTLEYNVYVGFEGESLTNIGSVTTSNVTTALSRNNVLKVGLGFYSTTANYFFNGFFNDICIKDATNDSIDSSSDHFDNDEPYEVENRIEGFNTSWVLGKYGDVYFNKIKEKDNPLKFHMISAADRTKIPSISDFSISDTWETADYSNYVRKGTKALYGYIEINSDATNDAQLLITRGYGETVPYTSGGTWILRLHSEIGASGFSYIGLMAIIYAPDGKFEYRRYSSTYPIRKLYFRLHGYLYQEI